MQHLGISWILLALFLVASTQKADAQFQNPRWIIPPYDVDFLSTPPSLGFLPHWSSTPGLLADATPFNSISDPCTNEMEFYVMGDRMYYFQSSTGSFDQDPFNFLDEDSHVVAIVPKPGNPDRYYVIYTVEIIFSAQLRYIEYDAANNQVIIASNPHPRIQVLFNGAQFPVENLFCGQIIFDASFPDNNGNIDLYFHSCNDLFKVPITQSGIQIGSQINPFGQSFGSSIAEFELSGDHKRIVSSVGGIVNCWDLQNPSSPLSSVNYYFAERIFGFEFSLDGKKLAFTVFAKPQYPTLSGIYVMDLTNVPNGISASAPHYKIQNSEDYSTCFLEMAYDGLVYATARTAPNFVKGFDFNTYQFDPASEIQINNLWDPFPEAFYTPSALPHQIDCKRYYIGPCDGGSDPGGDPIGEPGGGGGQF